MLLLVVPRSLLAQRATEAHPHPQQRQDQEYARATSPSKDSVQQHPDALNLYTADGSGRLRFESRDGDVEGRIGGRIMFDHTVGSVDDGLEPAVGAMADGTEFRRARLFTDGSIYDIGYTFQIDFAEEPSIEDMYLTFPSPVPDADIKVGKFKEDISLVEITSSKYITFMARPMLTEFTGGRDLGVRLGGRANGGALNYGVGVYRDKVDDALGTSRGDGDYKGTGRVTYVPWSTDENRNFVHVGASGSVASLDPDTPSEEAHEPEVHLAPDFLDTGPLNAEHATRLGLESALVYDAVSVRAEFLQKEYGLETGGPAPTFDAWYVSGSYFLTGEHRPYDGGAFGRVAPHQNVRAGGQGGLGAWEVAARVSTMDLSDSGVAGGEARTLTLGLNWYLNPSVRVMANYTRATVEDAAGTPGAEGRGHFLSVRVQLDF
jgi:phosphate-selective porin OprO/OprP